MRILFLDTETNGLPKNRYAPYTKLEAWPTIVQLAWQVWDLPACLKTTNLLLKPDHSLVWDAEAAAIHGISREKAEQGMAAKEAMALLAADAAECGIVVIHNLAFDKPVVWSMAHRTGLNPTEWWPKREICTMLETVNLCKIPSTSKYATEKDPYKWPRLEELYTFLFPTLPTPVGLHDAAKDVACLVRCFLELHRRGLVCFPRSRTRFFNVLALWDL